MDQIPHLAPQLHHKICQLPFQLGCLELAVTWRPHLQRAVPAVGHLCLPQSHCANVQHVWTPDSQICPLAGLQARECVKSRQTTGNLCSALLSRMQCTTTCITSYCHNSAMPGKKSCMLQTSNGTENSCRDAGCSSRRLCQQELCRRCIENIHCIA